MAAIARTRWRTSGTAALALFTLALALLLWPRAEVPLADRASDSVGGAPPATGSTSAEPEPATELRGDVSPAEIAPYRAPDLDHPHAFRLELRVVDAFGLPVPDAMVFLAPPACGFALLPQPTDAAGRATIEFRGRTSQMELTLAVLAWGVLQPIRRIVVTADMPRRLTLAAAGPQQTERQLEELLRTIDRPDARPQRDPPRRAGRLRRRDELDVLCGRTLLMYLGCDCRQCHEPSRIAAYQNLRRAGELGRGLHPHSAFVDQAFHDLPAEEVAKRDRALVEQERGEDLRRRFARPHRWGWVVGTVLDANGKPAAAVPVAWLDPDGSLRSRTMTDLHGRYRLDQVVSGTRELVAGGGESGRARTLTMVVEYGSAEWHDRLQRGSTVQGRATDERGNPLAGFRVEFECEGEPWTGLATTREDGSFLLANVPGRGRCLLWGTDADLHLPVLTSPIALPDGESVSLHLDRAVPSRARLRLRPVLPSEWPRAPVEARVYQDDTGRGALLVRTGQDEHFELDGLAAGSYRIEVGAPGLGWVTRGPVIVDGRGLWDLGAVVLPVPGTVRLRVPDGTESPLTGVHGWYRRTEAVDVREQPGVDTNGAPTLPPGEHLLLWQTGDGVRGILFRVDAGRTTDVAIPPR
jgi:protocatechuate 3,4-dioxygenase beta subunit